MSWAQCPPAPSVSWQLLWQWEGNSPCLLPGTRNANTVASQASSKRHYMFAHSLCATMPEIPGYQTGISTQALWAMPFSRVPGSWVNGPDVKED